MAKRKTVKKKFDNLLIEARAPSARGALQFLPRVGSVFPIASVMGIMSMAQEKGLEGAFKLLQENPEYLMTALQEMSTLLAEADQDSLPDLLEEFFRITEMRVIKKWEDGEDGESSDVEILLADSWNDLFSMMEIPQMAMICIWAMTDFFSKR